MTKPVLKSGTAGAGIDWKGLIKILALQVAVLLALAAAAIAYINWTSEVAVIEFMNAGEASLSVPPHVSQPKQVASSSKRQCDHR